ncbi:MAG: tetratricopeptide repeat protein [Planctomycetaceae bacterium]|nr:tetratricopeptide repeat protein [Planctomycetaceae bacterium]
MRNSISIGLLTCFLLVGCSGNEAENTESDAASKDPAKKSQNDSKQEIKLDPQLVMKQVQALYKEGNYREAFPLLNKLHIAKVCPAEGYALRAQILDHSGLTGEAIASLMLALKQERDRSDWHNMLGLLLVKGKNISMAQQAFSKAVELDPKNAKAYNNRGLMYITMQEFGTAINDFNAAIQASPEYIDAYNNRGYAYLEQGSYTKAIKDFTHSISLNSEYVKGYNNRGFALMKMGNAEQAIEDFTAAIELSPNTVKHYLHRRDAWLVLEDQAEADKDMKLAQWVQGLLLITRKMSRDIENPALFIERAKHYTAAKKYDKALEDISQAIKRDVNFLAAYNARAQLHFDRKEYQPAIDQCTKALGISENFEARSRRGDAYLALGKIDDAIADFQTAERIDQEVANAFWKRSEIKSEQGDKAGAQSDRETALKLDPNIEKNIIK